MSTADQEEAATRIPSGVEGRGLEAGALSDGVLQCLCKTSVRVLGGRGMRKGGGVGKGRWKGRGLLSRCSGEMVCSWGMR